MITVSKGPVFPKRLIFFGLLLALAIYLLAARVAGRSEGRAVKGAREGGAAASLPRVYDDGEKTYIVVKDKNSAAFKVVSRSGGQEAVEYRFVDGTYVIDRVLKKGERIKLHTESEIVTVSRKD